MSEKQIEFELNTNNRGLDSGSFGTEVNFVCGAFLSIALRIDIPTTHHFPVVSASK